MSVDKRYAGDPLNPAFVSSLEDLIEQYQPNLWIHGHTHVASIDIPNLGTLMPILGMFMKATISSQEAKSRHRSPANGQPSLADALFTSASDIDLLIVADGLTLEDVYSAVAPVETLLDRQVSPTLYTTKEFSKRRDDQNPLLMRILPGPKTILMGSIDGE